MAETSTKWPWGPEARFQTNKRLAAIAISGGFHAIDLFVALASKAILVLDIKAPQTKQWASPTTHGVTYGVYNICVVSFSSGSDHRKYLVHTYKRLGFLLNEDSDLHLRIHVTLFGYPKSRSLYHALWQSWDRSFTILQHYVLCIFHLVKHPWKNHVLGSANSLYYQGLFELFIGWRACCHRRRNAVPGYPIGYSRCYKSVFYGDIVRVNVYLYPWPWSLMPGRSSVTLDYVTCQSHLCNPPIQRDYLADCNLIAMILAAPRESHLSADLSFVLLLLHDHHWLRYRL